MIISHFSPTVSRLINESEPTLNQWFNKQFALGIATQYANHLLIQIWQIFEWTPQEQACAHHLIHHSTTFFPANTSPRGRIPLHIPHTPLSSQVCKPAIMMALAAEIHLTSNNPTPTTRPLHFG